MHITGMYSCIRKIGILQFDYPIGIPVDSARLTEELYVVVAC